MTEQSQQVLKKRKALLIFPLVTLPFLAMAFWALGGGKGNGADKKAEVKDGLSMELPDAVFKRQKDIDKMGYYEQAQKDSARLKGESKNDPYFDMVPDGDMDITDTAFTGFEPSDDLSSPYTVSARKKYQSPGYQVKPSAGNAAMDANERRLVRRISELEASVNEPERQSGLHDAAPDKPLPDEGYGSEAARLQEMMDAMQASGGGEARDPQMDQMDGMLDKILDIQDPARAREKLRKESLENGQQVYPVTTRLPEDNISLLGGGGKDSLRLKKGTGFYSLDNGNKDVAGQNAVRAVIHEGQTLVNGSVVKLRTTDDTYVNGNLIPKNLFVFGTASLSGERLRIEITGIRYRNSLLPVSLAVFDLDGLDGIHIPGAITREVAKQSANDAVQGIGINSISNSLSVQAASAGIEAVKTLASRKVRLVKVKVKAGYKVLLKSNQ
jgi:conjugative transposon TraM protein